jgi:hypothetical protein
MDPEGRGCPAALGQALSSRAVALTGGGPLPQSSQLSFAIGAAIAVPATEKLDPSPL